MATQHWPQEETRSADRSRGHGSVMSVGFGEQDDEYASIISGQLGNPLSDAEPSRKKRRGHGPFDGPRLDDREERDDDRGDAPADTGVRIEDLAVANERGEVIGSYTAPKHMTVEEAYTQFVRAKTHDVCDFDSEIEHWLSNTMRNMGLVAPPGHSHAKSDSADDGDDDDDDDEDGGGGGDDDDDPTERALGRVQKRLGGKFRAPKGKRRRGRWKNAHEAQREQINMLCEAGSSADRDYLISSFQEDIRMANVDEETFFRRMCPLCGYMDNTQDAIGNHELQLIDRFADEGIGNMDPSTHATLLAFLWNKTIYVPMRRRNMRILPLTSRMAYQHLTEPHRLNTRAELLGDVMQLKRMQGLLFDTAFKRNEMTGELGVDKTRIMLGLKVMEDKYKILNAKQNGDPFRTAHRVTAASAGTQTNPLQATAARPYRADTQTSSIAGAGSRYVGQNFWATPAVNTNQAQFTLASAPDGRSTWRGNYSALSNGYYAPGARSSKRLRNNDGYPVPPPMASRAGALTPADFPGFGRPAFDAVPTAGLMSNHTVPSNEVVMVSPDRQDELPGIDDLAIMRIDALQRPQQWSNAGDAMLDTTPRDTWNLAAFNHYLARQQKKLNDVQEYVAALSSSSGNPNVVNWHDPHSIMSHFYAFGVVLSDEKSDKQVATPRLASNKAYDGSGRRKAGLTISGRNTMFNIWGRYLEVGTNLFLVLRPVKRPGAYVTNNYNKHTRTVRRLDSRTAADLEEYPFQLIPHASMSSTPPDSTLLYRNKLGVEARAPYVHFATVFKMDDGPRHFPDAADISRDIGLCRAQRTIDVIVNA